jgi:hypothetical protein
MASEAKHDEVRALGPDRLLPRAPEDLRAALGDERITVVADVVGGPGSGPPHRHPRTRRALHLFGRHRRADGRRSTCARFYLRDLTFTGSTVIDPEVMPNLVRYIEAARSSPALAATYPLEELRAAQAAFIESAHRQHRGDPVKITRIRVYKTPLPYVDGSYARGAGNAIETAMASVVVIDTDAGLQGCGEFTPCGENYMIAHSRGGRGAGPPHRAAASG